MGDIVTKNTVEKVRPNHLLNAPVWHRACLVVLTTGSQGFVPAAKRLAVLLLASRVRRGWSGVVYPHDHAAKWTT